jgi:hypothetical protein
MKVSADVFEAFMNCATKCWLRAFGEPASGNAYAEWVNSQKESYRADAATILMADVPASECDVVSSAENLKTAKWRVAVGVELRVSYASRKSARAGAGGILPTDNPSVVPCSTANLEASPSEGKIQEPPSLVTCLDALERVPSEGRGRLAQFIPIRFFSNNKLTKNDRLLLEAQLWNFMGPPGNQDDHAQEVRWVAAESLEAPLPRHDPPALRLTAGLMATRARGSELTKPNAGDAELSANCGPSSTKRFSVRYHTGEADISHFGILSALLVDGAAAF